MRATPPPATVPDLLNAAADRIETHGWQKNAACNHDHGDPFTAPSCAEGAFFLALGLDPCGAGDTPWTNNDLALIRETTGELMRTLGRENLAVPAWNDFLAADAAEVAAQMRAAARVAEAGR